MPSFSSQQANLVQAGPITEILVAPPQTLVQALRTRNEPVPAAVRAVAIIDTGATGTVLTPSVIGSLGIQPVGVASMSTPSTTAPVQVRLFNVDLTFIVGTSRVVVSGVVAMEAPLGGQHIQCLIGRDVLRHGVLVYIGYLNQFTLSF